MEVPADDRMRIMHCDELTNADKLDFVHRWQKGNDKAMRKLLEADLYTDLLPEIVKEQHVRAPFFKGF